MAKSAVSFSIFEVYENILYNSTAGGIKFLQLLSTHRYV